MGRVTHGSRTPPMWPDQGRIASYEILDRVITATHICGSHTQRRRMLSQDLKKGTTPLLILALLEHESRHGYELSKLIESRSGGAVRIHAASLYPLLYRMEKQGWIRGAWVEQAGERRRRFYHITDEGSRQLEAQRRTWVQFALAIRQITGVSYA